MNNFKHSFSGLSIAPVLLEKINKLGFVEPTPIQHKTIPIAIEGNDIIGVAQTGTGKTLAFGIPLIQRLVQNKGIALILVPTRELAIQVNEALVKFAHVVNIGTAVLIGGESIRPQLTDLRKNPRIIIATPGRLIDHLERKFIRLNEVHILVLDEADRMLDMGFAPQIDHILKFIPKNRQTMLFGATISPSIIKIASSNMRMPIHIEIDPTGTIAKFVSQEMFVVKKDLKIILLDKILKQYTGPILLFTRTKIGAKKITSTIRKMGHAATEIHSDRTLYQRKEALNGFKSGKYRILTATDIAARGIDVIGIELVINYDLPEDPENYVHRIGRTGRAGQEGHAISFATPEQKRDVDSIEKIIRKSIPISQHPEVSGDQFIQSSKHFYHKKRTYRPYHSNFHSRSHK